MFVLKNCGLRDDMIGGGGRHNGKIVSPKPFRALPLPTRDRVKRFHTPFHEIRIRTEIQRHASLYIEHMKALGTQREKNGTNSMKSTWLTGFCVGGIHNFSVFRYQHVGIAWRWGFALGQPPNAKPKCQ